MSAIILACTPAECEKIANGDISILVRKVVPKETPFKVYIYCTSRQTDEALFIEEKTKKAHHIDSYRKAWEFGGYHIPCFLANGKVIGSFIYDKVDEYTYDYCDGVDIDDDTILETAIEREDINIYAKGKPLYGLRIADLKIYDKPKELSEFKKPLDSVYCSYYKDYCEEGCVGFGSTDYVCNDYWNWEKGLTRPPKNYIYVEE